MVQGYRFPYSVGENHPALMPRLPLTLHLEGHSVDVVGLVDSGASVNVLPYSIGGALGAIWEEQNIAGPLAGSLGQVETRALIVEAFHPQLTPNYPVRLIFAWADTDSVPVIFGQTNFLEEFRVCFDALAETFEVYPNT